MLYICVYLIMLCICIMNVMYLYYESICVYLIMLCICVYLIMYVFVF